MAKANETPKWCGPAYGASGRLKRLSVLVQALAVAEDLTPARRVFVKLEKEYDALKEALQMSDEFRQDGKSTEPLP